MEKIDYTKLMPPPPEDIVEEILRQGAFKHTDIVIFKCEYITDPLTEIKERMAKCICTACKEVWYEHWESDAGCSAYNQKYGIHMENDVVRDGDVFMCPHCGAKVTLKHFSHISRYNRFNKTEWITVFGRIEDKFTITEYAVVKQYEADGQIHYEVKKYMAYIFETDKRCIQLQGFRKSNFRINFCEDWWQKSRCNAVLQDNIRYLYPYFGEITKGTTMENSRFTEYMKSKGDKYPASYLRLYQRKHKIETIMDIGLVGMVQKSLNSINYGSEIMVSKLFNEFNWEEKSPYKIIGFDRNEVKLIKKYDFSYGDLINLKELKEKGIAVNEDNIVILLKHNWHEINNIISAKLPLIKTAKYLNKQGQPFYFLEDYWNMAKKLNWDMNNLTVKYPKNLKERHDFAVTQVKWTENQKNKQRFKELSEHISTLNYSDGSICIRIAQSEQELIAEGKILDHCVGGYGESHCLGQSIFFVRKSESPDIPWYTLQVNLKTGTQLQLHGYKNDREQPIPQEVKDFVNYWLKNIFMRFDVDKMEFIKKQKTAV